MPWYLDAVAGPDSWDVAIVEDKTGIDGVLPYVVRRNVFGLTLTMAMLTYTLGPWVRVSDGLKHYRKLSFEKTVMNRLIDSLPQHAIYRQNWDPDITNWQPFYWRGFQQTTRYTYVLPPVESSDQAWKRIEQKTRNQIRRAEDTHRVSCAQSTDTAVLWTLIRETFLRQGMSVPYSKELFHRLQDAAFDHGQGLNIVGVVDGMPVAGAFFVWDGRKMYYLASGSDRSNRETHALSLVLWEGIKLAIDKGLVFDFEGTMLENVEPHFRSFGAVQTPYFHVWRYGSRIAELASVGRTLVRRPIA